MAKDITVSTVVHAPMVKVWECWTGPEHIKNWCMGSPDWGVGPVSNDVRIGGHFSTIMQANDGSAKFDFNGEYSEVEEGKLLAYTIEGGRKVRIMFDENEGGVSITETFDMENENPKEMQRAGWQFILDNFKRYSESMSSL